MFVFDRSAFAVLLPLLLLAGAVVWSKTDAPAREAATQTAAGHSEERPAKGSSDRQTVAASLPSR
jgi:hypothetical protein